MAGLLAEPRWAHAAQALVDGCVDLPTDEDRVALLAAVCDGLGDALYPAFLRVLAIVGRDGDHAARAAVAGALVHALRTGRLPSGRRGAWGRAAAVEPAPGYAGLRRLGPLEYLCAWYAQGNAETPGPARETPAPVTRARFEAAACALMDLIACNPDARTLYCNKLLADVENPIDGTLTRRARDALRALAASWAAGSSPLDASARFLNALDAVQPGPMFAAWPTAPGR
ncbi:MAG: hypothetical protein AB7G13_02650 [Lautropia sp.]